MTNVTTNQAEGSTLSEQDLRNGIMPRAQLSLRACQIAVEKATNSNAREFAGFELEEATAVVNVLKDMGTADTLFSPESEGFIEQLQKASGGGFDKLFMQAELDNHAFLRDLTKRYLNGSEEGTSPAEKEMRHLATLVLFAFDEHVAMCTRINRELN